MFLWLNKMSINKQHLTTLLQRVDEKTDDFTIKPCSGGGNNRVFILSNDEKKYIVKWYYSHPSDTRNRLQAEYRFLEYTNKLGLCNVPKALACLPEHNLALYEFIEGRKLKTHEISENRLMEAADFFAQLNSSNHPELTQNIFNASDACFSIKDHLYSVEQRAKKMMDGLNPADDTVYPFAQELNNKLNQISKSIETTVKMSLNTETPLETTFRCISPSDFGFHNALLQSSDQLCFIDFEYAGWDDPAKMICDFFCQPEIPADFRYFNAFVEKALQHTENLELLKQRVVLLLPLHKIKWCFIMLNEFLPQSARRRQFANPTADLHERKLLQIAKATSLFDSIR